MANFSGFSLHSCFPDQKKKELLFTVQRRRKICRKNTKDTETKKGTETQAKQRRATNLIFLNQGCPQRFALSRAPIKPFSRQICRYLFPQSHSPLQNLKSAMQFPAYLNQLLNLFRFPFIAFDRLGRLWLGFWNFTAFIAIFLKH